MQNLFLLILIAILWCPITYAGQSTGDSSNITSNVSVQEVQSTIRMNIIKINDKNGKKEVQIKLTNIENGKPVTLKDLKEVHTQKIHLLIIDRSLEDYSHIHPIALNTPGTYSFVWKPKLTDVSYKIWADLTPIATGKQEYDMTDLMQTNKQTMVKINKNTVMTNTVDGYKFSLQFENNQPQAHKMIMGNITVTDSNGKPITNLEPVMGAFAHIVGFYDDDKTIVHIHPLGVEPTNSTDRSGPTLEFHMIPIRAGFVKLFVQVNINGKEIFVPFGFTVIKG